MQLNELGNFIAAFFHYLSLKNKSIAVLCIDFLAKTIEKNQAKNFTQFINPHYLRTKNPYFYYKYNLGITPH